MHMSGARLSLAALMFLTIASIASILLLLLLTDPAYADRQMLGVFYLSVFIGVGAVVAWVVMLLRSKFSRVRRPMHYFFSEAVRRGALIGAIASISLLLQAQRELTFLSAFIIVAAALMVEAFFTRRTHFRR